MKPSKMGLGGSSPLHSNQKQTTSPMKRARVNNVTARPGGIGKITRGDALLGAGSHSPVKGKGK